MMENHKRQEVLLFTDRDVRNGNSSVPSANIRQKLDWGSLRQREDPCAPLKPLQSAGSPGMTCIGQQGFSSWGSRGPISLQEKEFSFSAQINFQEKTEIILNFQPKSGSRISCTSSSPSTCFSMKTWLAVALELTVNIRATGRHQATIASEF